MRPRQWVKNVLVGAAPLAAGRLFEPQVLTATVLAFIVFSIAASGIYLVNDASDVQADRAHPTKRLRPVASGVVAVRLAAVAGVALLVLSLGISIALGSPALSLVVAVYCLVQLAYCFFLKHQPVLDLAVVAAGFLLRAVAGGVAAGIVLSQWFLLVASFGSLFMVAGKRYSELRLMGPEATITRASLREYSESYLRFVWSLSAGVAVTTYSLWAFELRQVDAGTPFAALSIVPFVLAILRYAVDIDKGTAGAPEDIALNDRVLQLLALAWLTLFGLAVLNG